VCDLAQTLAAYPAMASNRRLTYRDQRLKGVSTLKGRLTFHAVPLAQLPTSAWPIGTTGPPMGAVFNWAARTMLTLADDANPRSFPMNRSVIGLSCTSPKLGPGTN